MAYNRTVHTVAPKTTDMEIHTSTLVTDQGEVYHEIREYIVSLDQYGRGVTIPASLTSFIAEGLAKAQAAGGE